MKLEVEKTILEAISRELENGTDFDDPRGGGGYIYGGAVVGRKGRAVFGTPTINDDGDYFEISCVMKTKRSS